jgi:hypothetical protein
LTVLKTETWVPQTIFNCTLSYECGLHEPDVLDEASAAAANNDEILTAEQVAKVLAGVSVGAARTALEHAGRNATIAGRPVTVNQAVEAQYIADGTPAVWIVGARVGPANRVACFE